MKIKVKYLPPFCTIINKKDEIINIPKNYSIKQLLKYLADKYGEKFKNNIFPNGNPNSDRYIVNIILDDEIINKDYILKSEDTITIFMTMSGG
ncbi:MAG TPA: MoaD/ThiS family protein [Halanaerobiales bacterium]|nr:MoaD/ThiS family protein [Halanaerobiales bacterium]